MKKVLQYAAIGAAAGAAAFALAKFISERQVEDLESFVPHHLENESILWQPPEAGNLPLVDIPPEPENLPLTEEVEIEEIDIEE